MIRLDCNELPLEISVELKQEGINRLLSVNWNRYPSIDGKPLRQELARVTGWPEQQIFVGNGSDELLQALFIGLTDQFDTVVLPVPTFGMYKLLAQRFKKALIEIPSSSPDFTPDLEAIIEAVKTPGSIVFICQPNNPTGRPWTALELAEIAGASRGIMVIDKAYGEFCSLDPEVPLSKRSVLLRTFSKGFGAAGLRFGYALSSSDLAEGLMGGLLPYNVNALTEALVPYYLERRALVDHIATEIRAIREALHRSLAAIPRVKPLPSEANFILFKVDGAEKLWRELCAQDIYIRAFSEPLLSDYLRVTVGLPQENERFVTTLRQILGR